VNVQRELIYRQRREILHGADLRPTIREQLRTRAPEEVARYARKERAIAAAGLDPRELERQIALQLIDEKWVAHLNAMEYLREGIYLRAYAQQDPLIAYKKEAREMFQALRSSLQEDLVTWMLQVQPAPPSPPRQRLLNPVTVEAYGSGRGGASALLTAGRARARSGRNAPCPCGSGRKAKRCCQGMAPPAAPA